MDKPVGKKVTSVHPLGGFLSSLSMMKDAALGRDVSRRSIALTDKVGDITIDTTLPTDTDIWETGVLRKSIEGEWVIVSQYDSQAEAILGHKNWVDYLKENPACELKDINTWNIPERGGS